jgi:hypothetical protein
MAVPEKEVKLIRNKFENKVDKVPEKYVSGTNLWMILFSKTISSRYSD